MVEEIIYIGPVRVDCIGVGPQQCYQLKTDPADDWTLHYGAIEGFDFQPGYEYQLKVWKRENADPPADAASWTYVMVEELNKTSVMGGDARLHDIWVVTTLAGQPLTDITNRPRLELFPAEGRVGGNGSCNNIFGSMSVDGQTVEFSQVGATKMFCAGLMEQESTFLELLGKVDNYEIRELQLLLLQGSEIIIHCQKVD